MFVCFNPAFGCQTSINLYVILCHDTSIADNNECTSVTDSNCTNPACQNTDGSYVCGCDVGYGHNDADPVTGGLYCVGEMKLITGAIH